MKMNILLDPLEEVQTGSIITATSLVTNILLAFSYNLLLAGKVQIPRMRSLNRVNLTLLRNVVLANLKSIYSNILIINNEITKNYNFIYSNKTTMLNIVV